MKKALTIAGSDCSGGAGIQADLKTFAAHGVYGMSVITAVTAQNTQGVMATQDINPEMVAKQMQAVFEDIHVDAVKIGMVSRVEIIRIIALQLKAYQRKNIVLDTVMVSKNGYHLLNPEAKNVFISELMPLATVVTPNIPEAEAMTGLKIKNYKDMEKAAKIIYKMGPENIVLKGGHLESEATDIIFDGRQFIYLKGQRIQNKNTHGTGCTLSSAIAANLAKGYPVINAVEEAKAYIHVAIEQGLSIGKGIGPTHHFYTLYQKAGLID